MRVCLYFLAWVLLGASLAFFPSAGFAGTTNLTVTVNNPGTETATSTTFSHAGGGSATFAKADGTEVLFNFPANFSTQNLRLQANSYPKDFFVADKPAFSGKSFAGKTYDFNLYTPAGTQISTVNHAVTIALGYTDADITGLDVSTLAPYHWGAGDSSWQLIPGATVDTANKKVTFTTSSFSSFALLAAPPPQPPAPVSSSAPAPSGGGGGGGGGGYVAPAAGVTFSGRAYPLSKVSVLKDGQLAITTIAGPDANFSVALTGLSSGNYIFSVFGEDSRGRRSTLFTFPTSVTSGAVANISGIFITPTIAVDKETVKRGENIAIFGQSAPRAEITIAVNSEKDFFGKAVADSDGAYLYNFDTALLDGGGHIAKSKSALGGAVSSFSQTIGFAVGTKTVFTRSANLPVKSDLNGDARVNLVDFSIAAYWYKRPLPPASADLNNDGRIDLVDFSIMAFYWTG